MDIRLDDHRIIPLLYRIQPGRSDAPSADGGSGTLPDHYPTDASGRILAYSDAERDAVCAALDAARIGYDILPEDQPDPGHLAALQGSVTSRSEALAALAHLGGSGAPPDSVLPPAIRLARLEAEVRQVEAEVADLRDARSDTTIEEISR